MNLDPTIGVAETALGVTGAGTPGLTPHAQAEPGWYPVWVVSGDDAKWESWGWTDDGEWRLEAEPETGPTGPRLEVTVSELGRHQMIALCPESARALMAMCQRWLASLEATGAAAEPELPKLIDADEPLARRLVHTSMHSATLRGVTYRFAAAIDSWVREDAR